MNSFLEQMLTNSIYLPIKSEAQAACDGCLSEDRALSPVGKLRELFFRILNHDVKDDLLGVSLLWQSEPRLCWECHKMLWNTYTFQQRVFEAQKLLHLAAPTVSMQSCSIRPASLSNLVKSYKEVYDYHLVNETPEPEVTFKSEPSDTEVELFDEFDYNQSESTDIQIVFSDRNQESDVVENSLDSKCDSNSSKMEAKLKKSKKAYLRPKLEPLEADDTFTRIYTTRSEWEEERRKKAERDDYDAAELKCEKCILVFRKKKMLVKHNESVHDPEYAYKCDICPAQLETEDKLRVHQRTHMYYKCNMCQYKTSRPEYIFNHFENSHKYNIKCSDCDDVFPSRRELDAHVRERHRAFVCDDCGKLARSKEVIARHIHNTHMPTYCKICEQGFKSVKAIKAHNKLKHTRAAHEARYCVECDVAFDTGALYRSHLRFHHGKKFPCPKCSKSYKTNWHLRAHYSYFHERRTPHYCQQCDKYFIRKFALDRHERRMHQHVKVAYPKKHICEHCSRGFAWIRDLIQHVRTHTGERPHACALCPARFAQESPLVTHARRVHGAAGGFREILEEHYRARAED